jgi:hypothetical protein
MCGGGGGGGRASRRRTEWAKRGLTSLAASFDFRRMGVISIPSSIGNKRHSSSATRGSISYTIKFNKSQTYNLFPHSYICQIMHVGLLYSLTWPSLPILTGFPSFQGLYRCWVLLNGSSFLKLLTKTLQRY